MNGENLTKNLCKLRRCIKNNSPNILTGIAVVGVIATSIMSIKATPKALERLAKAEKKKDEKLSQIEKTKIIIPVYAPTAIIGFSTIACMITANTLNRKHQASIISAYALLNESYKKYIRAAKAVYGDDADSKIKAEIAKKTYVDRSNGYQTYIPEGDLEESVLFYDSYSERFFNAPMSAVLNAQYHVNRNLQLRGSVSVNEYYEFIGISTIENGDDTGWNMDKLYEHGIAWLDFDNMLLYNFLYM